MLDGSGAEGSALERRALRADSMREEQPLGRGLGIGRGLTVGEEIAVVERHRVGNRGGVAKEAGGGKPVQVGKGVGGGKRSEWAEGAGPGPACGGPGRLQVERQRAQQRWGFLYPHRRPIYWPNLKGAGSRAGALVVPLVQLGTQCADGPTTHTNMGPCLHSSLSPAPIPNSTQAPTAACDSGSLLQQAAACCCTAGVENLPISRNQMHRPPRHQGQKRVRRKSTSSPPYQHNRWSRGEQGGFAMKRLANVCPRKCPTGRAWFGQGARFDF